ncbi:MAG: hypothetical protein H6Q18_1164 [Bacteroidetes bacterium]|nr:hypothetical protein [Bacteroidota bacterium]
MNYALKYPLFLKSLWVNSKSLGILASINQFTSKYSYTTLLVHLFSRHPDFDAIPEVFLNLFQ